MSADLSKELPGLTPFTRTRRDSEREPFAGYSDAVVQARPEEKDDEGRCPMPVSTHVCSHRLAKGSLLLTDLLLVIAARECITVFDVGQAAAAGFHHERGLTASWFGSPCRVAGLALREA